MLFLGSPRKTVRMVYSALGTTKNVEKWENILVQKKISLCSASGRGLSCLNLNRSFCCGLKSDSFLVLG